MNRKRSTFLAPSLPKDLQRSLILPIVAVVCQLGLTQVITTHFPELRMTRTASPQSDSFRAAVNKAMQAAQLTQSAKSNQQWNTITISWQDAIDLMKAVPTSSPNYQVAQKKVYEYQRNLRYALSQIQNKQPSVSLGSSNSWSLGSRRADLLRVQGQPTGVERVDNLCKEIIYYNTSKVEVQNGIITAYENSDNSLRVSMNGLAIPQTEETNGVWTVGSKRDNLLKVQGTPTQIIRYDSLDQDVFFYGSSTVELRNGIVTAYNNLDKNLRVSVNSFATTQPPDSETYWKLGSTREEVFSIQGTPTQIMQYDSCKEVLYYENSTVELRYGVVDGYQNLSNILKVK